MRFLILTFAFAILLPSLPTAPAEACHGPGPARAFAAKVRAEKPVRGLLRGVVGRVFGCR